MNTKRAFSQLKALILVVVLLSCTALPREAMAQNTPKVVATAIAWSPDGTQIATGGADGAVNIWNALTGNVMLTLTGHKLGTSDLAWSPDGTKLLSGSADGSVFLWDATNGQLLRQLRNKGAVTALTWRQDGKQLLIAAGEEVQDFYLWDAETGQLIRNYPAGTVARLVRSPDGRQLAIVGSAGVIAFADSMTFAGSDKSIKQPEGYGRGYDIYAVAWSLDSKQIATGSANGVVRIWDMGTHQIIKEMRGNDATEVKIEVSAISAVAFSADGSKLFSLSTDGTLRGWVVATGQVLATVKVKQPVVAYDVAWSAYSGRLAFGGELLSSSNQVIPFRNFGNGVFQVVAPFPSEEELQSISEHCVTQADAKQTLAASLANRRLPEFISAVKKLSKEQIPPACAADLVAVAEVLSKGQ